jgi:hypothetical protein
MTGQGPTMIAAPGMERQHGWRPPAMPGQPPPQEPKMNTMRIATPLGYSSRPPRRVWPVVLIGALVVGLVAGVVSVTQCGHGGDDVVAGGGGSASASGSGTASAGTASAGSAAIAPAHVPPPVIDVIDAGAIAPPAIDASVAAAPVDASPAARPAMVRLSIDSIPPGATVAGPTGETLGVTPLKTEWPVSDLAVTFELRLGGYKKKQRQTVINSNTALHVELERLPVVHHPPATPRPPSDDGDNGLMRP